MESTNEDGSSVFSNVSDLDFSTLRDEEVMKLVHQLRVGYQLKHTIRYGGVRDLQQHSESVAEHVYALLYLSLFFHPLEREATLDLQRIHHVLLFHDFGEIQTGDIPYHLKTTAHEQIERGAALEVFASLPKALGDIGYQHWKEYEERQTPEAKFVYALDKIEPLFELLHPVNERSMKELKFTYEDHIVKKTRATEEFPVMRRFLDVITKDMVARDVFWPSK